MPGGNKNIKPSDGKQFSKDYQPPEKWTEKKALKVGEKLLKWLKAEDENMFFDEFLYINNDYHPKLISYLSNKFSSFLTLLDQAKQIQQTKLIKFGCFDKLNATMTKFVLINHHNHTDKSQQDITSGGEKISNDINFTYGDFNDEDFDD